MFQSIDYGLLNNSYQIVDDDFKVSGKYFPMDGEMLRWGDLIAIIIKEYEKRNLPVVKNIIAYYMCRKYSSTVNRYIDYDHIVKYYPEIKYKEKYYPCINRKLLRII